MTASCTSQNTLSHDSIPANCFLAHELLDARPYTNWPRSENDTRWQYGDNEGAATIRAKPVVQQRSW
eukprot:3997580-Prorocentrum_lima.AAC.1